MATNPHRTATDPFTKAITDRLITLMSDRGMNPTSLSAASGVDRRAIDGALMGSRDWKTSHLDAIATALSTDLATLVSPAATFIKAAS